MNPDRIKKKVTIKRTKKESLKTRNKIKIKEKRISKIKISKNPNPNQENYLTNK